MDHREAVISYGNPLSQIPELERQVLQLDALNDPPRNTYTTKQLPRVRLELKSSRRRFGREQDRLIVWPTVIRSPVHCTTIL